MLLSSSSSNPSDSTTPVAETKKQVKAWEAWQQQQRSREEKEKREEAKIGESKRIKVNVRRAQELALKSVPGLLGFNEFGVPIQVPVNIPVVYWEGGAFMATKHFNASDSSIVPGGLAERLQECNLHLTFDLLDLQLSFTNNS
jgi:hypothetical protein